VVRRLLHQHFDWTGSPLAPRVLAHWPHYQSRFVKVMPHDLKRALEAEEDAELDDRAV
jgi:glutamate synthase domain-containing protein 3